MASNNLSPFVFDDALVRVRVDERGSPWFVAKDVCRVLEIVNHHDALASLDDDEKGVAITDPLSTGGKQEVRTISESGLYSLIFRSRKPEARRFRKWVTGEVLPAIRKTGSYVSGPALPGGQPFLLEGDMPPDILGLKPRLRERGLDLALQFARQTGVTEPGAIRDLFLEFCRVFAARPPMGDAFASAVERFASDNLAPKPGSRLPVSDVYERFRVWWRHNGKGHLPTKIAVSKVIATIYERGTVGGRVFFFDAALRL